MVLRQTVPLNCDTICKWETKQYTIQHKGPEKGEVWKRCRITRFSAQCNENEIRIFAFLPSLSSLDVSFSLGKVYCMNCTFPQALDHQITIIARTSILTGFSFKAVRHIHAWMAGKLSIFFKKAKGCRNQSTWTINC